MTGSQFRRELWNTISCGAHRGRGSTHSYHVKIVRLDPIKDITYIVDLMNMTPLRLGDMTDEQMSEFGVFQGLNFSKHSRLSP